MENNTVSYDGDIELEDAAPSWQQKSPRKARDSSLYSAAVSDEDHREDAEDSADEGKSFSVQEEKAVVRKLDRHLVLFIAFLYMLSFLDRSSKFNRQLNGDRNAFSTTTHQTLQISETRGLPA